jgi:Flp pilus assembly protein TadG
VTEFAIILPVILLILLGIADFGRLFASAVAVEAAGREAADFGAFDSSYWSSVNVTTTVAEMQRRACTAAAGSHLEGYSTTDVTNATCTNPAFTCTLERNGASTDCLSSGGFTNGVDCSDASTEPPCTVHVRMTYQFNTLLPTGPVAGTLQIVRDSRFRVSNLQPAP